MLSIIQNIRDRVQAYCQYRNTISELSHLSDRDLKDLGIHRSDIEFVAHRSVEARRAAKKSVDRVDYRTDLKTAGRYY